MFGRHQTFYGHQIEREEALREQQRTSARLVLAGMTQGNDLLFLLSVLGLKEDT